MSKIFISISEESQSETIAYPEMTDKEREADGRLTWEICRRDDPTLTPEKLLADMRGHNRINTHTGYESI